MRAYVVTYAGLAERPSRTISGEIIVQAEHLRTAAGRSVDAIAAKEHTPVSRIRSLNLRITKGGTIK